jgi:hypothetical protein
VYARGVAVVDVAHDDDDDDDDDRERERERKALIFSPRARGKPKRNDLSTLPMRPAELQRAQQ